MKSKDRFKLLKAGIAISEIEEINLNEGYRTTLLARCKQELAKLFDGLRSGRNVTLVDAKDNTIIRTITLLELQESKIESLTKLLEARDLQIKALNMPSAEDSIDDSIVDDDTWIERDML